MDDLSWLGEPIDARGLFATERARLVDYLRTLDDADWQRPVTSRWTVRDVVAHVLGDDYGRIARDRDGHFGGGGPQTGEDLASFIHRQNQDWVDATQRISARALVDTLELSGAWISQLFLESDQFAPSLGVSWAGVDPAPRWLDCARELTEYWVHRQQVREATGAQVDTDPTLLGPVLDTFFRALPITLAKQRAVRGSRVRVTVADIPAAEWTVTATDAGWSLVPGVAGQVVAEVQFDADTAWRMATRAIEPATTRERARASGDSSIIGALCELVAIVR
ncbi:uncharacterized protein (TIGR03083 family) [Tamaricihabitans halophyticus]|uniref:Uncharacterized protein (TIGR03083 family) n=1 Tax=Tamaricihabitans halophyticus TaxID=1262583 RepID=A0A4R2R3Z7_9PSEU|nr:maleylpyruvate isomerase family mycothiol-dependent enzyme [Tamaricihabitans halophyticus]TCP57293.1 uncharacterized protein (TIGR03083 family) [Tamaricihabitans halophyticus]